LQAPSACGVSMSRAAGGARLPRRCDGSSWNMLVRHYKQGFGMIETDLVFRVGKVPLKAL